MFHLSNVGAPRHVLEDVSASDMDSVAQVYVVAPARTYLHVSFAKVILCCSLFLGVGLWLSFPRSSFYYYYVFWSLVP